MRDREPSKELDSATGEKRPYQSPVLTEYGSVDELVDAGVVGFVPSIVIQ